MPEDIIRRPTEAPQTRQAEVAMPPAPPIVDVKPAPTDATPSVSVSKEIVANEAAEAPTETDGKQPGATISEDRKSSKPVGVIVVAVLISATLISLAVYLGMKS